MAKFKAVDEVEAVCNYCGKKYKYAKVTGDLNMGACYNPRCVRESMRDHL
jgi:hypothetical protein